MNELYEIRELSEITGTSIEFCKKLSIILGGTATALSVIRGLCRFMVKLTPTRSLINWFVNRKYRKELEEFLLTLGVSSDDLRCLSLEDAFWLLIERITKIDNEIERMVACCKVFGGRNGQYVMSVTND